MRLFRRELANWVFNAAGARAIHWAEAFAAGRGETLGDDHLLLAVLWDNRCFSAAVFRRLGVTRAAMLEALRREGGSTPDAEPPPDPPQIDWGEKVALTMDELEVVVRKLLSGSRDSQAGSASTRREGPRVRHRRPRDRPPRPRGRDPRGLEALDVLADGCV